MCAINIQVDLIHVFKLEEKERIEIRPVKWIDTLHGNELTFFKEASLLVVLSPPGLYINHSFVADPLTFLDCHQTASQESQFQPSLHHFLEN